MEIRIKKLENKKIQIRETKFEYSKCQIQTSNSEIIILCRYINSYLTCIIGSQVNNSNLNRKSKKFQRNKNSKIFYNSISRIQIRKTEGYIIVAIDVNIMKL